MEYGIKGKSVLQGPTKEFQNKTVAEYFRYGLANGQIQPKKLAIVDGEKKLSFQQLNDDSTKIASVILESVRDAPNHNSDGDLVIVVCIEPSDKLITTLFGILKAGAAYVPLDITFEKARIEKIVNDCRPLLVICDGKREVFDKFESVKNLTKVLSTDELYKKMTTIEGNEATDENVNEDDTAIVMYTSGSSGEPKGVRLSHKAILNRLQWQWDQFPFAPTEKCVFKTGITFGESVAEIFGPLLQGFPVIVFEETVISQPPLLMQKLHDYDITRVVVVPSLLKAIFEALELIGKGEGWKLLGSVKLWVCSGETLSYDLLKEFFEIFPENFTLCNFYGSTEVMGDAAFVSFASSQDVESKVIDKRVPIGFPLVNTAIYILDENLQQVEQGQTGEVFVAGSNLSKGYVGISDSDKFLDNPFTQSSDFEKLFRTGDFGKIELLPNGKSALMYEGRMDSRIKVRGQRVEFDDWDTLSIPEFDDWSSLSISKWELATAKSLFKIISEVTGSSFQTIAENMDDSFFNIAGSSLKADAVIVKLRDLGYYISNLDFTSAKTIREILKRISPWESEPRVITNIHNESSAHPQSLNGKNVHNSTLFNFNMRNSTLHNCTLHNSTMHTCTMISSTMHNSTVQNATLHNCTMHGSKMHHCTMHHSTLHNSKIHTCSMHHSTLHDSLPLPQDYNPSLTSQPKD